MLRLLVSGLVSLVTLAGVASAQNSSQVFGKVTDPSGGVLPGATVTVSSPALLEPRAAVRVRGERLGQNLDRHVAAEPGIPRAVDVAHPARPEQGDDLV